VTALLRVSASGVFRFASIYRAGAARLRSTRGAPSKTRARQPLRACVRHCTDEVTRRAVLEPTVDELVIDRDRAFRRSPALVPTTAVGMARLASLALAPLAGIARGRRRLRAGVEPLLSDPGLAVLAVRLSLAVGRGVQPGVCIARLCRPAAPLAKRPGVARGRDAAPELHGRPRRFHARHVRRGRRRHLRGTLRDRARARDDRRRGAPASLLSARAALRRAGGRGGPGPAGDLPRVGRGLGLCRARLSASDDADRHQLRRLLVPPPRGARLRARGPHRPILFGL
jgi:hypothetical protein